MEKSVYFLKLQKILSPVLSEQMCISAKHNTIISTNWHPDFLSKEWKVTDWKSMKSELSFGPSVHKSDKDQTYKLWKDPSYHSLPGKTRKE